MLETIVEFMGSNLYYNIIINKFIYKCYTNKFTVKPKYNNCRKKYYESSFHDMFKHAVDGGNQINFLKGIINTSIIKKCGYIFVCKYNNIECLKYLNENSKYKATEELLNKCLHYGSYDCLIYCSKFYSIENYIKNRMLAKVTRSNIDECLLTNAIKGGCIKCFEFLHKNCKINIERSLYDTVTNDNHPMCDYIALNGNTEILTYALNNGCLLTNKTAEYAIMSGNVESLDIILGENELTIDNIHDYCIDAICYSQLDILEYFNEVHDYYMCKCHYYDAADNCDLEILKFLFGLCVINDPQIYKRALSNDENIVKQLQCLDFLREMKCV
jgi:hypothetical protein